MIKRAIPIFHGLLGLFHVCPELHAAYEPACPKYFRTLAAKPATDLQSFLPATQIPLPRDALERIRKHPISTLARRLNEGQGWVIALDPMNSDGSLVKGAFGESLQAHFVAKTLRVFLPKAEVLSSRELADSAGRAAGKKLLKLSISDSSETLGHLRGALNMTVLKPANPTFSDHSRAMLRKSLGIGKDAKVVSFYIQSSDEVPNLKELDRIVGESLSRSRGALDPELVFLSLGGQPVRPGYEKYLSNLAKTHEIRRLSEISDFTSLKSERPLVILNDTQGRMPYINGSADLNFVYGPVNLYEGLNFKTPLIFFSKIGNYGKAAYERMSQIALATGGATRLAETEQITSQMVKELLTRGEKMVAPYQTVVNGANPFDTYLNELNEALQEGLEQSQEARI